MKKEQKSTLKWSTVECDDSAFFGDTKGFVSLEEIDDVEVSYEHGLDGAKTIVFKPSNQPKKSKKMDLSSKLMRAQKPILPEKKNSKLSVNKINASKCDVSSVGVAAEAKKGASEDDISRLKKKRKIATNTWETIDIPSSSECVTSSSTATLRKMNSPHSKHAESVDVSAWKDFCLHKSLVNNLSLAGFKEPTAIQRAVLPLALQQRDIVGAAQTGSGKTLAFGLSIAQYLLSHPEISLDANRPLLSLIISPTRELAIQICDHISQIIQDTPLQIMAIIGGLSREKQERLLLKRPQIVVATPGRLYELISEQILFLKNLQGLRFFVIDEADRIIQQGHFKELEDILKLLPRTSIVKSNSAVLQDEDVHVQKNMNTNSLSVLPVYRQTMLFSATLTLNDKQKQNTTSKLPSLQNLLRKIDFKDKVPTVVDLTANTVVATGIVESQIHCLQAEKDNILYYFCLKYPGRTLVFLNSIDAVRRLLPLLQLLRIPTYALHAEMQQRQRLKNVDRFKSLDQCVLLASDVAARGLDIPNVDHVIHFQVPKNIDTYVHRCGRTARGNNQQGTCLLLVGPEEVGAYGKLTKALDQERRKIDEFIVESGLVKQINIRVTLARKIEVAEHRERKQKSDQDWMRKAAEAMELDYDDEDAKEEDDDHPRKKGKSEQGRIAQWKKDLDALLEKPIIPRGVSFKYLTSHPTQDLPSRLKITKKGGILASLDERDTMAVNSIKRTKK